MLVKYDKVTPSPDGLIDAFVTYFNENVADYDLSKISKS